MTLAASDVPAHALFVDYRTADGRQLEPEIFPRPDGEVYVCGMADPAPLPDSPDEVEVSEASCAVLARAAARVSSALAAAPILRRQACYRPVTDDGLPLIGRVPGLAGAYVATGHGPWGMLNAPATGLALAELIVDGRASSVDLPPSTPRDVDDDKGPSASLRAPRQHGSNSTVLVRLAVRAIGRLRRKLAPSQISRVHLSRQAPRDDHRAAELESHEPVEWKTPT